jgi:Protein of unknown function (DUF3822)
MQQSTTSYKPLVSFFDETFDVELASDYHLSIEIALSGFSYTLLDTKRNKYIGLESFQFQKSFSEEARVAELSLLLKQISSFKFKFKSVSVSLFSLKFTLIPAALFDSNLTSKYLEFNTALQESDVVLADSIKNFETHCVYAVHKNLVELIQTHFPAAKFLHTLSSLLDVLSSSYKNVSGKNIVIHLQQGHFELIVLEDKKLLFANLFSYQSSEDFLYYTLFVCEQLKLNPENMDLLLLGEVEKNSAIYSILNKYVRNIRFGSRPDQFDYSYLFDQQPSHFYFNLYSQALCV